MTWDAPSCATSALRLILISRRWRRYRPLPAHELAPFSRSDVPCLSIRAAGRNAGCRGGEPVGAVTPGARAYVPAASDIQSTDHAGRHRLHGMADDPSRSRATRTAGLSA